MFYDVVQKLSYRAFKINHNGLRMRLLKLKFVGQVANSRDFAADVLTMDLASFKTDFEINLDDERLMQLESENKRVALIVRLRQKASALQKKYSK